MAILLWEINCHDKSNFFWRDLMKESLTQLQYRMFKGLWLNGCPGINLIYVGWGATIQKGLIVSIGLPVYLKVPRWNVFLENYIWHLESLLMIFKDFVIVCTNKRREDTSDQS